MEEINQNLSKKVWLKWVVLVAIVLIAAVSGVNFYQISVLKTELGGVKTTISSKVEPVLKVVETLTASITPAPSTTVNKPIEITGIIKFIDLEGGCWSIAPQQSSCTGDKCPLSELPNYEIINIPTALKKDGIKAKFKLEVLPDVATTCQIGPVVKILEYQIIK